MTKVKHRLRVLMAERDIKSITELSKMADIDYRTLYNFYTYVHKKLDPVIISKLCKTLNCDIGELLILKDEQAS